MLSELLIRETVVRFPKFADTRIEIEPLEKGGSDRKYYRVRVADHSLILVKYGTQRAENRQYVAIANFLASLRVTVPKIYFHDESECLIWMEDLGALDLWECRNLPWPERSELYRSALEQIRILHSHGCEALDLSALALEGEFNADLYRWEQNYFFENCLARFFHLDPARIESDCDRGRLDEIATFLDSQPRVLVHRDFQSQNILIRDNQACLIDFQGLRPGLCQYDLASLLYDPYVYLTAAQRAELCAFYTTESGVAGKSAAPFSEVLDLCAMQRLMQALGAYGFLGLVKNRDEFLAHIPAAMNSLREVVGRIPGLGNLRDLLAPLS